ncbi:MAG: Uma2 family endonuclease [Lachnospiraceae bacterium]|nr:Uma2 family endonuclease [Lachnospiraceae bacterium]
MDLSSMRYYKQQKGYTFAKLSEVSGVPIGTIQKIFNGETKSPRYETLQALEEALKPAKYETADMVCEAASAYVAEKRKLGPYTLEDYYALPDDRRVELIDGVIYDMAAPTTIHQMITAEIYFQIRNYIKKNKGDCVPFISPVDVQLDCDEWTMVQPDVLIVCDKSKITKRCIMGAPDFIVEVLSPTGRTKDAVKKLAKYLDAGVKEYWIVNPEKEFLLVYVFEESQLPTIYRFEDEIPVHIYDGELKIDFKDIKEHLEIVGKVSQ